MRIAGRAGRAGLASLAVLATLLAAQPSAQSQASLPVDKHWQRVENLVTGESIMVRDKASGVDTACLLDYANDVALACHPQGFDGPQTPLVYKRDQITRVWVERLEPGRGRFVVPAIIAGALFGGGIGAVLGGAAGSALGLLLGGLTGATTGWHDLNHPVVRRHRIYAAP